MIADHHREYLAKHAVDPDLAEKLGVSSVTAAEELPEALRWAPVPGLLYPWRASDEGRVVPQYWPDEPPLGDDGKPVKCILPKDEGQTVWLVQESATGPVAFVEGEKQALAVASLGWEGAVYALHGCWGFSRDERTLPELHNDADGRPLYLALDADVSSNRNVWDAAKRALHDLPVTTGCSEILLVTCPGSGSTGVDDVLADHGTTAERLAVFERMLAGASRTLRGPAPRPKPKPVWLVDSKGRLLSRSAALAMSERVGPFAVHEGAAITYRYDADRMRVSVGAVTADAPSGPSTRCTAR